MKPTKGRAARAGAGLFLLAAIVAATAGPAAPEERADGRPRRFQIEIYGGIGRPRPAISIRLHPSIMVQDFSDLITADTKSFLAVLPSRRKIARYSQRVAPQDNIAIHGADSGRP